MSAARHPDRADGKGCPHRSNTVQKLVSPAILENKFAAPFLSAWVRTVPMSSFGPHCIGSSASVPCEAMRGPKERGGASEGTRAMAEKESSGTAAVGTGPNGMGDGRSTLNTIYY